MRRFAAWMVVVLVWGIAGCGEDIGQPVVIKGKVTLDGKPMEKALIGFAAISEGLPAKYRYKSAKTGADGTYTIEDVYQSEYMVQVTPSSTAPADATKAAVVQDPVAAKYGQDSPLRAQVAADKTEFNFDLTSAK